MADKVITSTGDCSDCCGGGTACSCALLIPPQASPYVDYAAADGVIADPLLVADCLAYNDVSLDMTSFSAAFDGTTFTADGAWSSAVSSFGYVWISISAKSGATLTFDSTAGSSFDGVIYTCDGTEVEVIGPAATPITSAALPADGEYYLKMLPNDPPMGSGPFTACTITVTSSDDFWVNPVIALWDDSGTTRQLEACPKMLLPPLTEAGWGWWADCANAALAISGQSADCLVYNEYPYISMSAVDSGTGVNLDAVMEMFNPPIMWVSLNLEAGETLTAAYTASVGAVSVTIFDYEGNEVETLLGVSPLTSAALPYTGRYIVRATGAGDFPVGTTVSVDYTSSGAISANQIQSLYNIDLDCPARLNCGDSCP